MKVSIVIPAYNESENIHQTVLDIQENLQNTPIPDGEYEVIVVDDHSSDHTFEMLPEKLSNHITILRLSRRSGSHVALRAGLNEASGDVIICIAADGQDDPEALPRMIGEWQKGYQVVWALRETRKDEPIQDRLITGFFYFLLRYFSETRASIDLSRADFYLLDRKVVDAINTCTEKNTSLFGLIIWLGFNQTTIEYRRKKRRYGSSKWNFRSKLSLAKDWIIAFSGIPLRLLTYSGFAIAGIGFLYALLVIVKSILLGSPVPGWSSVMTVILILGGGQAIMLGIIGEYLWRTIDESRNRPNYFIEKRHDNAHSLDKSK